MAHLLQLTAPFNKLQWFFLCVCVFFKWICFPSGLNQLNPRITWGNQYKSVLTADYLYKQTTPSGQGQPYWQEAAHTKPGVKDTKDNIWHKIKYSVKFMATLAKRKYLMLWNDIKEPTA